MNILDEYVIENEETVEESSLEYEGFSIQVNSFAKKREN